MKKLIPVLLAVALLCAVCCSIAEERTQPEIRAVFSSSEAQIITDDDQTKELADTTVFVEEGAVDITERHIRPSKAP